MKAKLAKGVRVVDWPLMEALEDRRLFSVVVAAATVGGVSPPSGPAVSATTTILAGQAINAEAGQAFKAVLGQISGWASPAAGYTLQGVIDWGDGTVDAPANFVHQPNGAISIVGAHTYAAVGSDAITITLLQAPPPGSAAPTLLLGVIHSSANVISSTGGVTVEATAGQRFVANLGFFNSNLSLGGMTATINWGDGTSSTGQILALPTAGPVGRFEVMGAHTYAQTQSFLVNVVVTWAAPRPVAVGSPTPPIVVLLADIFSVIDVLPISPTAAA